MKLIFKTKNKKQEKFYLIRLPNYYQTEKVDELFEDLKYDLPGDEEIVEHQFYGDTALSLDERKQLDVFGAVINPPIELVVS